MKVEEMYSGAQKRRLAPLKFPIYSGQRPSCLSERGCTAPFTAPRHTGTQSQGTSQHHPILRVGWGSAVPPECEDTGEGRNVPHPSGALRVRTRWALCPALLFRTACFWSKLLLQPGLQTSSPHQGIPGWDQWLELGAFMRWSLAGEN